MSHKYLVPTKHEMNYDTKEYYVRFSDRYNLRRGDRSWIRCHYPDPRWHSGRSGYRSGTGDSYRCPHGSFDGQNGWDDGWCQRWCLYWDGVRRGLWLDHWLLGSHIPA